MPHQDETDKPLIAIWIPEAMEWSMLGSNTEEEEGVWSHTYIISPPKDWKKNPKLRTVYLYTQYTLLKETDYVEYLIFVLFF